MGRKAIRRPIGTIRSGRVITRGEARVKSQGRRILPQKSTRTFNQKRRTSTQRSITIRPPPPQISSRPKPPPRSFVQRDLPRGVPFGNDQIFTNRRGDQGIPERFDQITRPFQKFGVRREGKVNELFSPISQNVIGFESTLVTPRGLEKPRKRFSTDIFGVFS